MFTSHAVFCATVALNNFLSEKAIALNGVVVALAAAHSVFTKANHLYFRM